MTALRAEGCGIALWAMSFISRLRRSRQHRVSILPAYLVHPFPLRGTSPQGETRALRDWLSMSYGMISILLIGSLRSPPPYPASPDFPRSSVGQSKGRPFYGQARRLTSPHCGGSMQDLHSGTITRAYCRAIYEESVSRCFILPPEQGEVRRSRIGGCARHGCNLMGESP